MLGLAESSRRLLEARWLPLFRTAAQLSFVNNPGLNRDRGPIIVPGLRAHVDF
jgi:hypothetical protein